MASFPLKCHICFKNKPYSDISHMLTHVSSKAHLTAVFHAEIRAPQDPVLAQKVIDYQQWYAENNLAELLAERMAKKDEKKGIAKMEGESTSIKKENTQSGFLESSRPSNRHAGRPPIDPFTDVKQEPDTKGNGFSGDFQGESGYPDPTLPRQPWSLDRPLISQAGFDCQDTWAYGHPQRLTEASGFFDTSVQTCKSGRHDKSFGTWNNAEAEILDEMSKLKGIVWPGMGLFDAASPDGKRMRNQKKNFDSSHYLENMSEHITATEVVRDAATWHFREDREITGEASPLPDWIVSPVKRPRRSVLSEQDPNHAIIRPSCGRGGKLGRATRGRGRGRGRGRARARSNARAAPHAPREIKQDLEKDTNHDLLLLQGFVHGHQQPQQFGDRGLHARLQPEPMQRTQIYRDPESEIGHPQTSEYSYTSEYSFLRSGLSLAYPGQTTPYSFGTPNQQHIEISPIKFESRPEPLLFSSYSPRDARIGDTGYRYQSQRVDSTDTRLSVPASSIFNYPRPILNGNTLQQSTTSLSTSVPNLVNVPAEYNIFTPQQQHEAARALQALRTPVKREVSEYDACSRIVWDQSSGDETIDMGIESSPIRRVTRSASRCERR